MKMRIKKYFLPCFLPVIAVLCFVLFAPAFAGMKKVDEADLAKANASVTGAPIKDTVADVDKDAVRQETLQAIGTVDKGDAGFSPSVSKGSKSVDTYVSGHTASNVGFAGLNMITTGGITAAKPR